MGPNSPASLVQKPSETSVPASRTKTMVRGSPRLESALGGCRPSCRLLRLFNLSHLGDGNAHPPAYHCSHPCPCAVSLFQVAKPPESLAIVKILHSYSIHNAAPDAAASEYGTVSPLYSPFSSARCLAGIYPSRRSRPSEPVS